MPAAGRRHIAVVVVAVVVVVIVLVVVVVVLLLLLLLLLLLGPIRNRASGEKQRRDKMIDIRWFSGTLIENTGIPVREPWKH